MAYGKKSGQNPLTGRKMKTATSKSIGGRKSSQTSNKMRTGQSTKFGRFAPAASNIKAIEEVGGLGGGSLGGKTLGGGGVGA